MVAEILLAGCWYGSGEYEVVRFAVILFMITVIIVLLSVGNDLPPVVKGSSGRPTAKGTVESYRGRASIIVQRIRQHIPVEIGITSWSGGAFTGYMTIQAARVVTVPLTGRYTHDNISGSGAVSDGSLSISIRATRRGDSIMGTYQATVKNYRQYYLDSSVVYGDLSLSLVNAQNVPPMTHDSQVCTLSFTADTGVGRAIFYIWHHLQLEKC